MKFDSIAYLVLILFTSAIIQGQPARLYFENYSSENGLSQNSCYAIAQDDEGFMWFGTQDGLNRFDGKDFNVYLPRTGRGKKLPSNHITSLYYDKYEKQLWVGTARGLSVYDSKVDSIVRLSEIYPFAERLEHVPVRDVKGFKEGEYWILTINEGLIWLNATEKKITSYFTDPVHRSRINDIISYKDQLIVAAGNDVYTMVYEHRSYKSKKVLPEATPDDIHKIYQWQNQLWIGTFSSGLYYVEHLSENKEVHSYSTMSSGGIGEFLEDVDGSLWVGTRGDGVLRVSPDDKTVRFARYNRFDERSISRDFILSLYLDRQGIVWIGLSGGGIAKHDPLKYQFYHIKNDPSDSATLPDNMVFTLFKSVTGKHFVGTQNEGLIQWDMSTERFKRHSYFSTTGLPRNTVYDIDETDKHIWIASWGGLLKLNKTSGVITPVSTDDRSFTRNLYTVKKLRDTNSLFITGENGASFFSLANGKWEKATDDWWTDHAYIGRYVYEDENNILWICTEGGGLVRYDYTRNDINIVEEVKRNSDNVRFLWRDGTVFWIATDNGVLVYNYTKEKLLKHITFSDLKQSNVCYALHKDVKGYFWVSTNFGLVRIDPENYTKWVFDPDNGLDFREYNTACVLEGGNGTLLFGGVGGITRFRPASLKANHFNPDPIISSVFVHDKPLLGWKQQNYRLSHDQNFITFRFTANNFSNHQRNRYHYRLLGLSDQWNENKNSHEVRFNSLPPGDYTFQVKAANSDGIWSDQNATYSFVIAPPWWNSWWFLIMLAGVLLVLVVWFVKMRIRNIRKKAELKQRVVETEMMALRAQMNPHFIFNCLNSIDAFIQSNDRYQATVYLNKFARLLRNVLDSSNQNTVSFSRDLETLKLYIELEELRNENKFRTTILADEVLLQDDFQVPPLVVQPYVENAIIHGLKYKTDNQGHLKILANKLDDHIRYVVEDNGVGRGVTGNGVSKNKTSYGMKMSRDRVQYFNEEDDASVVITDLKNEGQPSGTRIELKLKLK